MVGGGCGVVWCGLFARWWCDVVFVLMFRGVMQVWQPQKPNFNLHTCSILRMLGWGGNPSGTKRLTKGSFHSSFRRKSTEPSPTRHKRPKGLHNSNAYLQGIIKLSLGWNRKKEQKSRVDATRIFLVGCVRGCGTRLARKVGVGVAPFKGHTFIQIQTNPYKSFLLLNIFIWTEL